MRAKRSLGQNFLVDPNLQRKIVHAVEPGPADTVIEIGPGRGALTRHLAGVAGSLVAVELDDDLAARLAADLADHPTVEIVHADVLDWDPAPVLAAVLAGGTVKVVGNIPYNITSPLLFRLLEWRPAPERIILMIQKEVADRLLAEPGGKDYGALTVGVRASAEVRRLFDVSRQAFRPVPGVESSVVLISPGPVLPPERATALRSLTRTAFGMRRKQLQKILRSAPAYGMDAAEVTATADEVGIRPDARPETLAPDTFIELADALARRGYPRATEGAIGNGPG